MSEPAADFDDVLTEHKRLNELFGHVNSLLEDRAALKDLTPAVEILVSHIKNHFRQEETTEFFERIAAYAPRLESEAMALKQQHGVLERDLQDTFKPILDGNCSAKQLREVAVRFADFEESYELHEEGENRLLQEAYDRDVGSKD